LHYLVTSDLKETQRQKEFHVSLILAGLDPTLEPYKA